MASAATANTIQLSWNDIYSDEDGFRVERYNDTFGSYVPIATVASNVTTFLDTGLMSGNFYFYRVVAFNSGGDSYAATVYAQATPMPAPEPLVVQYTTANTVALSWSDIYNNEDGFRVERYDWMFANYVTIATVASTVTTFLDTGLMPGNIYNYRVVAFNSGGDSYPAFVSTQATPVPAPEPLVVQYTTANTIALSWSDIYNNEDGFRVERHDSMFGTYVTVGIVASNVTTFLDTGLLPGNIYSYRVVAFNSGGDSYAAFVGTQATPIPAPEPLVVQYTTANTIALSWSDIYDNEDGFRVERYDWMFGNYFTIGVLASNVTTFLDTGLLPGNIYSYRVVAFNSGGDSYAAFVGTQATPIPAPEPLVVQYTTANTIALSWSDIYDNEDGFRVERYDWMFGNYVTIAVLASNVTTFLDTGLLAGNIYSYRVVAFNSGGDSYAAFVGTQATPIPAPEPLVVQYTTANTVALSWSDIYDNEDGFRLERYDWDSGNYVTIAVLASNVTTFLDTGVRPSIYFYRVFAVNSGGDSYAASVEAYVIAIPAPEPLVVQYSTANTIALSWSDIYNNEDGFRVERYDSSLGSYVTIAILGSNVTTFLDTGLLRNNLYDYRVFAFNSGGDSYPASVSAETMPISSPDPLVVTKLTANTIALAWSDIYSDEDGFRVKRYDPVSGDIVTLATLAANITNFIDTGLTSGNTYHYAVFAFNSGGESLPATVAAVPIPTPAPDPLVAISSTATTITLGWNDIYNDEDGFRVERYDSSLGNYVTIAILASNVTTFLDAGLSPGNTYDYRVVAFNSGGDSFAASVTALAIPVPSPGPLVVQYSTANTIALSWSDTYNNEDGFRVERYDSSLGDYVVIAVVASNVTTFLDTGLIPGNIYSYRVVAFNSGGDSYAASVSAEATPVASPGPLVVTSLTANTVGLAWSDIYSDEDGFRIKRSDPVSSNFVVIATLAANVTTFIDTGLTSGVSYYYDVVAFNLGGESYPANIVAQPTPVAAPDPLVAISSTATTITLGWNDIYSDEDGFRLERSQDGINYGVVAQIPANTTNFVDTGLASGTFYYYRVAAFNSGGDSYYSATLSAGATPVPAPDPLAVGAVSATQIALSWNDIYNNEDGFRVERSTDSIVFTAVASVPANTTNYVDSNLLPNTFYAYRVAGFNSGGDSYYSMTVNATTLPLPPVSPSGLTAVPVSTNQINLTWVDNSNNELAFQIERSTDGVNFNLIATVAAGTTSYSDIGLAEFTQYRYRVRATNAGGNSTYSNQATTTTLAATPPAAPSNLTLDAISSSQINLAWQDNAVNEAYYFVEISTGGAFTQLGGLILANAQSYSVTGLNSNTRYTFRVRCANNAGYSGYSNTANIKTRK